MYIIDILAPVFIMVALGAVLARTGFLGPSFFAGCTKLTYRIGLPSLLFYKIANAQFDMSRSGKITLVLIISSVAVAVFSSLISRPFPVTKEKRKTFIHTSFHCNTAFVGLPVIIYALGTDSQLVNIASMAVAPMIPFINIMSTVILRGEALTRDRKTWTVMLKNIVSNPLVIACILGILYSLSGLPIPQSVNRGLDSLGRMALPLALLSIGAGLKVRHLRDQFPVILLASLFNVILLPAAGILFSRYIGLTQAELLIALIFLACPTASSAFIYARELQGDPEFAGNVILTSTIISAVSLSLVLYLFM